MRITDEMKAVFLDATTDALIANRPNPTYFGLEAVLALIPEDVLEAYRLLEACRLNPRAEDEGRIADLEVQVAAVKNLCKMADSTAGRGRGLVQTFRLYSAMGESE